MPGYNWVQESDRVLTIENGNRSRLFSAVGGLLVMGLCLCVMGLCFWTSRGMSEEQTLDPLPATLPLSIPDGWQFFNMRGIVGTMSLMPTSKESRTTDGLNSYEVSYFCGRVGTLSALNPELQERLGSDAGRTELALELEQWGRDLVRTAEVFYKFEVVDVGEATGLVLVLSHRSGCLSILVGQSEERGYPLTCIGSLHRGQIARSEADVIRTRISELP